MADFGQRAPSFDEDFDAVAAPAKPRKPRTRKVQPPQPIYAKAPARPAPTQTPAPQPVAISISDEPTEEAPQAAQEVTYVHEATETGSYANSVDEAAESAPEPEYVAPAHQSKKNVKAPKSPKAPKAKGERRAGRLVFEAVLVLGLIGLGLWTWQLYTDRKSLKSQVSSLEANPQAAIQKQTSDLISTVGGLMSLPQGETPTIANVSDVTQARQQSAFFNNAANGDKVLMYVKAGEAILYRPSTNKIVLVAPLTFNNSTAATSSSSTTTTAKP